MPNKKLAKKKPVENERDFAFRIKMGEYEIEISGDHEEVIKTIENLPNLVPNIHKALENIKPKTVATLTVKTEAQPKAEIGEPAQAFPKIAATKTCGEAIFRILETDWGKWRPRTVKELKDAMKANGLKYSDRVFAQTLTLLAKKGFVRRWNTNTGFVYILAEKKGLSEGEEA